MIKTLAYCAALAVAAPALADLRVTYADGPTALFSLEVPEFWTLNAGGVRDISPPGEDDPRPVPQVLTLHPTVDPTAGMVAFSPPGIATVADGVAYLAEIEKFMAQEPTLTSNAPGRVAGKPAQILKGTGRRDGEAIGFTIAVVDLPGPRVAILAGIAETSADPALVATLNQIFASVRSGQ
jgi:hypothetical protein